MVKKILEIIRFGNFLMAFISVFLGAFLANIPYSSFFIVFLAAISASFITAFGNIHNDIVDVEIDRADGKLRPIATGEISLTIAKILMYSFALIGNLAVINYPILLSISLSVTFLLPIYNKILKRLPLVGNIFVAFLVGLTFLYGNLISYYTSSSINYDLFPFLLAFLLNVSRELIKDCEDIKGDSMNNIRTFPIVFGIYKSQLLVIFFNIILIIFIILSSKFLSYTYIFYIINAITTIPIILWAIVKLLKIQNKEIYRKLSKMYKIAMLTGVLSLFINKLI